MKKIILLAMLLFFIPIVSAYADSSLGYYGQNQYYYTVFDGEGEAATVARIEIQNTNNLSDLSFIIPGKNIEIIKILQEYYEYEKQCIEWGELACTTVDGEETCAQECLDYQEYPMYPPRYAEVQYTSENICSEDCGESVKVEIPKQDQENIYLIIYYKTSDYISKGLFSYKYNFQTIQDEYDTTSVRVSLDVTEDLYLQGLSSQIDYTQELSKGAYADVSSFAYNIAYIDTGYTETASSLDPYESFTVEGRYAKSWWCVHWWKVLLGALIGAGLLSAGIIYLRRVNKKNKNLALSLLLGLSSGILLWAIWLGAMLFMDSYYYWGYGNIQLFVILLSVLMSLFLLFVPSIFIGLKHGINDGFYCFIATIGALFVLGVITILIYVLFLTNSNPIVYY